jgi:hypothetical protein
MYLELPSNTCLVTMIRSSYTIAGGDDALFLLSKIIVTLAFTIPAFPLLYMSSYRLVTLTLDNDVIPRTKQMASIILDFPEPFNPVMALKFLSSYVIWVF